MTYCAISGPLNVQTANIQRQYYETFGFNAGRGILPTTMNLLLRSKLPGSGALLQFFQVQLGSRFCSSTDLPFSHFNRFHFSHSDGLMRNRAKFPSCKVSTSFVVILVNCSTSVRVTLFLIDQSKRPFESSAPLTIIPTA